MQSLTSELLTAFFLKRLEKYNPILNAFSTVLRAQAMQDAKASDARRKAGVSRGLLDGIPVAITDVISTSGARMNTTVGTLAGTAVSRSGDMSREKSGQMNEEMSSEPGGSGSAVSTGNTSAGGMNEGSIIADSSGDFTAALMLRLQSHGAIVIGRTHTVGFGVDDWGVDACTGGPQNPWDRNYPRVPGGACSGAAVAVAAGLVPCAIGVDMGGSLRIPAAFCSLTGLKMSAGLVDLSGTLPLVPMLDSVGSMTHTADDAAILYHALTSEPGQWLDEPYHRLLDDGNGLEGMTLGVMPDEQYDVDVQRSVRLGLRDMVRMAEMAGATIVRERPPVSFEQAFVNTGLLVAAHAWRQYSERVQAGGLSLRPAASMRLVSGRDISQMQYDDLLAAHQAAVIQWQTWMADKDAFMVPGAPAIPPLVSGRRQAPSPAFFTRYASWTGASALALPAGFDPGNMPVSTQLIGKANDDRLLLRIGSVIQSLTAWHCYSPTLKF